MKFEVGQELYSGTTVVAVDAVAEGERVECFSCEDMIGPGEPVVRAKPVDVMGNLLVFHTGCAESEAAVAAYRHFDARYVEAEAKLSSLNAEAERSDDYRKYDEYRDEGYASAVGDALAAARRALTALGY